MTPTRKDLAAYRQITMRYVHSLRTTADDMERTNQQLRAVLDRFDAAGLVPLLMAMRQIDESAARSIATSIMTKSYKVDALATSCVGELRATADRVAASVAPRAIAKTWQEFVNTDRVALG